MKKATKKIKSAAGAKTGKLLRKQKENTTLQSANGTFFSGTNSFFPSIQTQTAFGEVEEPADVQATFLQRAPEEVTEPENDTPSLQPSHENTSTACLPFNHPNGVQANLSVGEPNDVYEREADDMADHVARMPDFAGASSPLSNGSSAIQRMDGEEETPDLQASVVQRTPALQRSPSGSLQTSTGFASRLQATTGGGAPMAPTTQAKMETAFQTDFSAVRVHTDHNAVQLNREIGAKAFTYQNHIYFNGGNYNPASASGQHLLAHELTHTVQQGAAVQRTPKIQRAAESVDTAGVRPEFERAIAYARREIGKVRAGVKNPDGTRMGWERLIDYYRSAMGPEKIAAEGAPLKTGMVPVQDIKYKRTTNALKPNQVKEKGDKVNPNLTVERDAMPSWCGIFVFWALNQGGLAMPKWTLGGPKILHAAYPPWHIPKPGDIAYMNTNSHYALVVKSEPADPDPGQRYKVRVTTINGNTSGVDTLGGEVQQQVHTLGQKHWDGFFDPLKLTTQPLTTNPPPFDPAELRSESEADTREAESFSNEPPEPVDTTGMGPSAITPPSIPGGSDPPAIPEVADKPAKEAPAPEEKGPAGGGGASVLSEEPLMPEPSGDIQPEHQQRIKHSSGKARQSANKNATLPTAAQNTAESRKGVTEPEAETIGRASGALAAALDQKPAPSPEIEALCEKIKRVIREDRPPDKDSLINHNPEKSAEKARKDLNNNIKSDVNKVEGSYKGVEQQPQGQKQQIGVAPQAPPKKVASPEIDAAKAKPDKLDDNSVSLEKDVNNTAAAMGQAGMKTEVADHVQDGPIAEARGVHGELEKKAKEDPAKVRAKEEAAIKSAETDMAALQMKALNAVEQSRSQTITGTGSQQFKMIGSEEDKRKQVGTEANRLFNTAKDQVNDLLKDLDSDAMKLWETGKEKIVREFKDELAPVKRWVDEHLESWYNRLKKSVFGLPDHVTESYKRAEKNFGDKVCKKLREVSTHVNGVILACEKIIENVNTKIRELFEKAKGDLGDWAVQEQERFQGRINGLRSQVKQAQQDFNEDLTKRASEAVQEVREEVHALREAAKGLIGKIKDAIDEFREDPIKFLINGLLKMVNIEPSRFWALLVRIQQVAKDIADKPMKFANNLMAAVKAGFTRFFDNFGANLLEGLLNWLFSGLGKMGIKVPKSFGLKQVITFFLQIMGISWARIRKLLAKHIGEKNVAAIEKAYQMVALLIEKGPAGIYEMIKDKLNPQNLLDMVLEMAKDFIVELLVKKAVEAIVKLTNPAGAIYTAIESIYKVLAWIFRNAARIFSFVETIVNGMADIIAGNYDGMAAAIEKALKQLLVPVIDFVARLIGLGELPNKVAKMIKGLQQKVEKIMDKAIGFLAKKAKDFIKKLGFGKKDKKGDGKLKDTEVGDEMKFTADDERHKLWMEVKGDKVEVMISSTPMTVDEKLKEWKGKLGTLKKVEKEEANSLLTKAEQQYKKAKKEGMEANKEIQEALRAKGEKQEKEIQQAKSADDEAESAQGALKSTLIKLFELIDKLPRSSRDGDGVSFGGGNSTGYGTTMEAEALTMVDLPMGSSPSPETLVAYEKINQRRKGGGAYYVKGHLLSERLGGTGTEWKNLVPLKGSVNTHKHYPSVEDPVIKAVKDEKIVQYSVEAIFGRSSSTKSLENKVDQADIKEDPEVVKEIIRYEAYVPSSLHCEWTITDPKDPSSQKTKSKVISNDIEQSPESYDLIGERRKDIHLYSACINELQSIEGVDKALAGKLKTIFSEWDYIESYDTLKNMQHEKGGNFFTPGQRAKIGKLQTLYYVKLHK